MTDMPEKIKIDHESQIPVYKQIVGQVEELVRQGEYPEGCLLPSMNELSAVLDISKETVKKAYSILGTKVTSTPNRAKDSTFRRQEWRKS